MKTASPRPCRFKQLSDLNKTMCEGYASEGNPVAVINKILR
jgi:hypothetical protein